MPYIKIVSNSKMTICDIFHPIDIKKFMLDQIERWKKQSFIRLYDSQVLKNFIGSIVMTSAWSGVELIIYISSKLYIESRIIVCYTNELITFWHLVWPIKSSPSSGESLTLS